MKGHVFSTSDFELFEKAVHKWLWVLGLSGWRIEITHEQIGDGVNAQCAYNSRSKQCCFRLTHNSEGDFGFETNPEILALHEVLHLLLAELVNTASTLEDENHDLVIGAEHSVIHKLVGAFTNENFARS